jgi:hypothetical protein
MLTTIRSVTANTSGRVWLIRMTDALRLQLADQIQHLALLDHAQVVGRLVHDHQLGFPVDRARDGDGLALPPDRVSISWVKSGCGF